MNSPFRYRDIHTKVLVDWIISPEDRTKLERFYILHWDPTYLFSEWKEYLPIVREDITYLRIYHKCSAQEIRNCKVALLSFRKLPDMKYGTVLVAPTRVNATDPKLPHKAFATQLPKERS